MPGSWMSSTNVPRPRMKRASSLRGTGPYAPFGSALISLPPSRCVVPEARQRAPRFGRAGDAPGSSVGGGSPAPGCREAVAAFGPAPAALRPADVSSALPGFRTMAAATVAVMLLRCPLDRPHDVLVARAPADLAGQSLTELLRHRVRVVVEQPAGGQHHARRTEAALEPVAAGETLLDGVEPAVPFQAFHREHPPAVGHGGEHRARLHRQLVHPDHAGAAVRGVAAPVGAGQPELIAQEMDQQQPRLDIT